MKDVAGYRRCTISSVDSDVADGVPTQQMSTLALDAQNLCSNVSGQQLSIPAGSCMRRRFLLQVFMFLFFALELSKGFACEGRSWLGS